MRNRILIMLFISSLVIASCDKEKTGKNAMVIAGAGMINDEVDAFRNLLGDPLNNTTGVTGGRREVNWDGLPDIVVGFPLPGNLFNPVGPGVPQDLQRGLGYVSDGEFRVSHNRFFEVNPSASGGFSSYSGDKLFANISSNDWEIEFEIPGQAIDASVRGFGAVFTDVDESNSTSLEFFNHDRSLGKYFVPRQRAGSTHSFLGVHFGENDYITRIRVSHRGKLSDGRDVSQGGPDDLVALDDFFYDEPAIR